jgi:hypothetical protein
MAINDDAILIHMDWFKNTIDLDIVVQLLILVRGERGHYLVSDGIRHSVLLPATVLLLCHAGDLNSRSALRG